MVQEGKAEEETATDQKEHTAVERLERRKPNKCCQPNRSTTTRGSFLYRMCFARDIDDSYRDFNMVRDYNVFERVLLRSKRVDISNGLFFSFACWTPYMLHQHRADKEPPISPVKPFTSVLVAVSFCLLCLVEHSGRQEVPR